MRKHVCGNCYYFNGSSCGHLLNIIEGKAGIKFPLGYCKRWLSSDVMKECMKEIEEAITKPLTEMVEAFVLKADDLYKTLAPLLKKKGDKNHETKP